MNALLLLATSAGSTPDLSILKPASPAAESIYDLTILVLAITGFIFLIVEGVLIYCILRFRRGARGAGATPHATGKEPPQVYGSKPIEIAWTAAPALIVFILVLVTTRSLWEVNTDPPEPRPNDHALFVTVVGRQWWWEYQYDFHDGKKLGFITANELRVPVGDKDKARPVYLTLKSADVCHSFWVPQFMGRTDLIPGRTNHAWFQTAQTGLFFGQCAEYCGTQHANMFIRVIAEPVEDFEQWVVNEQKPAVDDPATSKGKAEFLSQSCINCHTVRFKNSPATGTYGPDLTHLMSRKTLASAMLPNTPDNLRAWIADPQKIKAGCLMPAFGLSKDKLQLIVDYLVTLR